MNWNDLSTVGTYGSEASIFEDVVVIHDNLDPLHGTTWKGEDRRDLAALCLHEQPFGFTRHDVEILRELLSVEESGSFKDHLNHLTNRIEALLPPKEP